MKKNINNARRKSRSEAVRRDKLRNLLPETAALFALYVPPVEGPLYEEAKAVLPSPSCLGREVQ